MSKGENVITVHLAISCDAWLARKVKKKKVK